MKKYILVYFLTLTCITASGQTTAPDAYFVLVKYADSLCKVKDYKNAALTYSSAFAVFGGKGYVDDRYNAACAWAMAGYADSAFYNLERIATRANYADYKHLATDPDLASLHNDSGWALLLQLVSVNKEKNEAGFDKPLLHLLDSLVDEDQKWRSYLRMHNNHEISAKADTILITGIDKNMALADSTNYFYEEDIFRKYGFPNYDIVGQQGSVNFWALIQHQDKHPDFQDCVLEKMKIEVDAKKAPASNYAYLVDRVKINMGELQIYGTQMALNADSTSYIPKPVFDPEQLNDRRKSEGLGTIESYIDLMNHRYWGTLKKR